MTQLFITTGEETQSVPCPRCKKPLVDPAGLGWCKSCGYCRSLDESNKKAADEPKAAPPETMAATAAAIAQTPTWFWVTLIGMIVIAGATYAVGRLLPMTPLTRAVLATVQMVAGFLMMFAGQFIGVIQIAPVESTLSFKDAVFPFRLYGMILKHLPSTRLTIYLGGWGLAAIIAAAVFVGGLDHWYTYVPGAQKNQTQKGKK